MSQIHPAQASLLKFFDYDHLPERLQAVSAPFHQLAHELVDYIGDSPEGAEVTTALRKLLEAKDCAVRAALAISEPPQSAAVPGGEPLTGGPAR